MRREIEVPLSAQCFRGPWTLSAGAQLTKVRWSAPAGEHVVTVAALESSLAGRRVVQVEFGSREEAAAFTPPDWFGAELTCRPEGRNRAPAAVGRR